MKFSGQILVRLVVPIVLGFLLIGLCAMVLFFAKVPGEIDNIQARLEANEYSHFGNNAAGAAKLVDNIFSDFAVQITAAATQARNVLGLDGSSEDPKVPTASIYPSYFAGQLDGVDPPLPPNPLDVSAYFNVNITTLAQFKAMQPDITANLDNVFRSAVVNQPRIRGIQIAFPDGGWRIYPLVYNLSTFNPLNNTFCNGEDVAPEFRGSAGFKPICRQFYLTAINAYPPSKPGPPNGITPAVFTKPYPSAITGQLLVGASISLYKNKQFYGVISLQILVASLANKLANTPILNNGYIYIIEKGGNVVLYPQSRTSLNIYNADMTTSISAVEFNSDAGLTAAFLNQVNTLTDTNRTGTFKKPDGSTWTFSAATVNSTSHILIVVAPNSDISALSDSMKRSYITLLAVAVTITVLCTVIAAWISYRVTGSLAQKILNPMESMVAKLSNIAVNELHFEFENKPLFSQELNNVNDNFKNLLTAVRFGNTAYYNDDLMLALDNYLAAEAMMIRLGNERGQGVCANNLGNVYRMLDGEFQKAVNSYNRAVAIATNMLNNPSNGEDTQATLRTVLANRLNNMGVLFKENTVDGVLGRIDAANAESFFEKSLALHRQTDNLEGIAQVSGNLGQLYLTPSVNKLAKAEELITDAFHLVRTRNNDPVAFQYACLNMGLLCEAQHKYAEAVTWYLYVLQRFDVAVKFIQKLVLTRLITLCEEKDLSKGVDRPELAKVLRVMAQPVFGEIDVASGSSEMKKNVTFVLDTSGSMTGTYIRTCRASIKEIIKKNCTDADTISLLKFDHRFQQVFSEMSKSDPNQLTQMFHLIDTNTEAEGGTAFYDAIAFALRDIAMAPKSQGDKWIVALTDGDDVSPNKVASKQAMEKIFGKHKDIGLIVITVGALRTEAEIKRMVALAGDKRGMLIRSEANSGGIKDAFGQAAKIMALRGNVNVESL